MARDPVSIARWPAAGPETGNNMLFTSGRGGLPSFPSGMLALVTISTDAVAAI
jgi:hypothetical protein